MKKTWENTAVLAALTAAALFTAACGGSGGSTKAMAGAETMAGGYESGNYESVNNDSMSYPEEAGAEADTAMSTDKGAQPAEVPAGRKLIRNVDMDVETDSFDALISGINSRISELGGYVEQSSTSGRRAGYQNTPIPRSASVTARIPSDKLEQFITTVEETGNVINKTETTEDVTLQYSDIESRKKSLSIEQDRIWELLEKADTLEAVITLEERLSEIRYQLESMESQLRLYDNQVDYSTVILRIDEVTVFTPTAPESTGQRVQKGFTRNWDRMCGFFVSLFVGLTAGSPIWVPIVCAALLLFYLGRKYGKQKQHSGGSEDDVPAREGEGSFFKKKK